MIWKGDFFFFKEDNFPYTNKHHIAGLKLATSFCQGPVTIHILGVIQIISPFWFHFKATSNLNAPSSYSKVEAQIVLRAELLSLKRRGVISFGFKLSAHSLQVAQCVNSAAVSAFIATSKREVRVKLGRIIRIITSRINELEFVVSLVSKTRSWRYTKGHWNGGKIFSPCKYWGNWIPEEAPQPTQT